MIVFEGKTYQWTLYNCHQMISRAYCSSSYGCQIISNHVHVETGVDYIGKWQKIVCVVLLRLVMFAKRDMHQNLNSHSDSEIHQGTVCFENIRRGKYIYLY